MVLMVKHNSHRKYVLLQVEVDPLGLFDGSVVFCKSTLCFCVQVQTETLQAGEMLSFLIISYRNKWFVSLCTRCTETPHIWMSTHSCL